MFDKLKKQEGGEMVEEKPEETKVESKEEETEVESSFSDNSSEIGIG